MKTLEITKGIWDVAPDSLEGDNQSYYILAKKEKGDCWGKWISEAKHPELYKGSIQETKDNAALIADAGNTYQECELLPSELLKQNKELREALEDFYGLIYEGLIKVYTDEEIDVQKYYDKIEQALNSKP